MKHRIFIAINLPENVRKKLEDYQRKWPELPVRWTKSYNLHITLVFLGYLSDEEILEVIKTTQEVVTRNESFSINLKKIIYGPPKKMPPKSMSSLSSFPRSPYSSIENRPPRMIWIEGEKSIELGKLQKDLNNSFNGLSQSEPQRDRKEGIFFELKNRKGGALTPHITLGRLKSWEFRAIEPEARPEVNEEINLSFEVNSIDVMESELKKGGPNYTLLESCQFKL